MRLLSLDDLRQPDPRRDTSIPPSSAYAASKGYEIRSSSYPCPEPGAEAGTLFFSLEDGSPAIWDGGVLYVKERK
jgi:hypothetical protein